MSLQDTQLFIFGPANGSVCFTFPGNRPTNDDSIFLASSTFSLNPSGEVYRLTKRVSSGKNICRIGIYRQVFEPGMQRLGHAFGVAVEMGIGLPNGCTVSETLAQVFTLVEGHCCKSGQFCSLPAFLEFLHQEIDPSVDGIIEELFSAGSRKAAKPFLHPERSRLCIFADTSDSMAIGRLIDWFFADASGSGFTELVIHNANSGEPGQLLSKVQSIESLAMAATSTLHRNAVTLSAELVVANENLALISSSIKLFEQEKQDYLRINGEQRSEIDALNSQIIQLKNDLKNSVALHKLRPPNIEAPKHRNLAPPYSHARKSDRNDSRDIRHRDLQEETGWWSFLLENGIQLLLILTSTVAVIFLLIYAVSYPLRFAAP